MSQVSWEAVLGEAVDAAKGAIGEKWPLISRAASQQISLLIANAKFIEQNAGEMTELEYKLVTKNQQRAFESVLTGFEAISIVLAEQAFQAAWSVIAGALKTATGLPFI
jgi:hypothetical protein